MKTNLGTGDRILRVMLGGGVVIAGVIFWSWWFLLGLLPLITAFVGYCPMYDPLHLNTCARGPKPESPHVGSTPAHHH
jgi:hypothetical protein